MPRHSYNYTQLGIGDCGHVVGTWPQVSELGLGTQVICDECMKQQHELTGDETLVVWVKLKTGEKPGLPKLKPVKKPRQPKPKKLSPWQTLLQQEGLFE